MITVGDYVTHNQYPWYGKMKVKSINFGTVRAECKDGTEVYYNIVDLTKVEEEVKKESSEPLYSRANSLYCECLFAEAEIVESSIQVQRTVDKSETFKFCRTCKKEKR